MTAFLNQLNNATISENINVALQFETFLLKKNASDYNFITLNDQSSSRDGNNVMYECSIAEYDKDEYRFVVRTKKVYEIFKFLGIPYLKNEGYLHYVCARLYAQSETNLHILVFGHVEYDILKKYVEMFISKYTDVTVNMTLEHPKTEFVVPELKKYGFWKLFKKLFIKIKNNLDESTTY